MTSVSAFNSLAYSVVRGFVRKYSLSSFKDDKEYKCVRDDPFYAGNDFLVLLSDVMIHVSIVLVSFHVLAIDQTFDSFLQILVVHRELEFRHDLVD